MKNSTNFLIISSDLISLLWGDNMISNNEKNKNIGQVQFIKRYNNTNKIETLKEADLRVLLVKALNKTDFSNSKQYSTQELINELEKIIKSVTPEIILNNQQMIELAQHLSTFQQVNKDRITFSTVSHNNMLSNTQHFETFSVRYVTHSSGMPAIATVDILNIVKNKIPEIERFI